ncbi:hypothetical protein RDV89_02185 [Nocardioides zeae]|uniref:DUF1304 domain-containing protein n=1 Tax=Nocardioides imazamoxiresistens TaxID=3231893 RepID=A0ABU3PSJ7_9ACTN|nr:hypothetical protein [Nocardioides zeae]MDT9591861.1 hypothetical protein [Nocardioides zeae]
MTTALSVLAAAIAVLAALHQLALAAGVPWGRAAYGGRVALDDGRLPGGYRAVSVANAVVLALAAWFLLGAGDVVAGPLPDGATTPVLWFLAVMFAFNTLANLGARHPAEKALGGATAVVTVCCVVLALA